MTSVPGTIEVEVRGAAGWMTITNPARRNALSTPMMADLGNALRLLDADDAVRAMVVTGAGEAFAAGADISEFEAQQTSDNARRASEEAVAHLFETLNSVRTPLIAMVRGHCFGAGLAVAMGADVRVAARGSSFAIPAARLGIGYPVALTQALVQLTGPAHAADILFTGRTLRDVEAERFGLVNRLVDAADLERNVQTLLTSLAVNAPMSMRTAKLAIRSATHPDLEKEAHELVRACKDSSDAREGQRAFLAKRAPVFLGR